MAYILCCTCGFRNQLYTGNPYVPKLRVKYVSDNFNVGKKGQRRRKKTHLGSPVSHFLSMTNIITTNTKGKICKLFYIVHFANNFESVLDNIKVLTSLVCRPIPRRILRHYLKEKNPSLNDDEKISDEA